MRKPRTVHTQTDEPAVAAKGKTPSIVVEAAAQPLTHMDLVGFLQRYGLNVDAKELSGTSKRVAQLCRQRKLDIVMISDARYGEVNGYQVTLLKEQFNVR